MKPIVHEDNEVTVTVRPMTLRETAMIIDYFHSAAPEHLGMLGVDPTRLPQPSQWQRLYQQMFDQPIRLPLRVSVSSPI
ncbi:hypothetical protein [Bradyrhizobium sp. Rc2d]|uniref:hypothetical protein n=1 Tax=Bradyrhizobium sp. Rc2d TaxID=1855321 RepID=UPI0015A2E86B|nr:hypothetical protein [Bradyrhizobium sp. Rc2d]